MYGRSTIKHNLEISRAGSTLISFNNIVNVFIGIEIKSNPVVSGRSFTIFGIEINNRGKIIAHILVSHIDVAFFSFSRNIHRGGIDSNGFDIRITRLRDGHFLGDGLIIFAVGIGQCDGSSTGINAFIGSAGERNCRINGAKREPAIVGSSGQCAAINRVINRIFNSTRSGIVGDVHIGGRDGRSGSATGHLFEERKGLAGNVGMNCCIASPVGIIIHTDIPSLSHVVNVIVLDNKDFITASTYTNTIVVTNTIEVFRVISVRINGIAICSITRQTCPLNVLWNRTGKRITANGHGNSSRSGASSFIIRHGIGGRTFCAYNNEHIA